MFSAFCASFSCVEWISIKKRINYITTDTSFSPSTIKCLNYDWLTRVQYFSYYTRKIALFSSKTTCNCLITTFDFRTFITTYESQLRNHKIQQKLQKQTSFFKNYQNKSIFNINVNRRVSGKNKKLQTVATRVYFMGETRNKEQEIKGFTPNVLDDIQHQFDAELYKKDVSDLELYHLQMRKLH